MESRFLLTSMGNENGFENQVVRDKIVAKKSQYSTTAREMTCGWSYRTIRKTQGPRIGAPLWSPMSNLRSDFLRRKLLFIHRLMQSPTRVRRTARLASIIPTDRKNNTSEHL